MPTGNTEWWSSAALLRYDAQLPGPGNWMVGLHEIPSYHSPDCYDGGPLDIQPALARLAELAVPRSRTPRVFEKPRRRRRFRSQSRSC